MRNRNSKLCRVIIGLNELINDYVVKFYKNGVTNELELVFSLKIITNEVRK